jgi:malonyl-CoA O-methyltransferase
MKYLNTTNSQFWLWLTSELSERMSQNLPFIRIKPEKIVMLGEFDQQTFRYFQQHYPQALIWSDTFNKNFFQTLVDLITRKNKNIRQYNKVQSHTFDMAWLGPIKKVKEEYATLFNQLQTQVKNNGLVMFNYLGPDTGKEIREIQTQEGWIGPDMHDIGDLLTKNGFADPVMNMEYIELQYENPSVLQRDLLGLGLISENDITNHEFIARIEQLFDSGQKFQLTLEVVYGHAWFMQKNTVQTVKIYPKSVIKNNSN